MTITELALKRPTLIIVLFTALILGGLYSYSRLGYELLPDFSQPILVVNTIYPGASPADIETSVTKKIEDAVAETEGVKDLTAQSMEGVSTVIATYHIGADMDELQQDLQRKLDRLRPDLPDDIKDPTISQVKPSDSPIIQLSATANLPDADLYDRIKNEIVPQLQQIGGIGTITILGGREREIQVAVNQNKLNYYGLSLLQVTGAISRANADFPTGKVEGNGEQVTVRLAGKFTSVADISNLIVLTRPDGSTIRVGDVADVADVVKEPSSINRFNGVNGVGLVIKKQADANAVAISREMKAKLATVEKQYAAQQLTFVIADDTSEFTLQAADAVQHDLVIAIILVSAVMLVFLHSLRDASIVLVSIPASLISTFIAMYALGYSLNLMTLLAMSLVIGILVDDSIVVLENIHRHLEMGKDKKRAALDGRAEIGFSALAITLVDVVVFLPIAFVNTTIGDILRQYSVTIVVSTLMSLLVCFTLTPYLASLFGQVTHLSSRKIWHRPLIWFERQLERFTNWYAGALDWGLHHKLLSGAIVLGLFGMLGWVMSLGILGEELVAQGDQGKFTMTLEYDRNTMLATNNRQTQRIENFLRAKPDVKSIFTSVGGTVGGDNKATLTVALVPKEERALPTSRFMIAAREELEGQFPAVKISSSIVGINNDGTSPIQIVLNGANQDEVMAAGAQLKRLIEQQPGANDVAVSVEDGKPEVRVAIDREKLARLGLDISTVGATLQTAFAGNDDAKYREGLNEYDIFVRLDAFDRRNPTDVANLTLRNDRGEAIKLSQVASISQSTGPSMLERKNRQTSVTVSANNLGISTGVLSANIARALEANPLPDTVTLKWSGETERTEESMGALMLALGAALVLVYFVMVVLYNDFIYPLVVLFSIPVALIGAFLALNLAKSSMSVFAMLGVIMLLGLVTKNAILIVDFANQQKARGLSTRQALMGAGRTRMRPILMTTLAMIVGMLPIALAKGAGAEWKNGLAIVMMGGLGSSLMLTVFVVPMIYYVVDALKVRLARRKLRRQLRKQIARPVREPQMA